MSKKDYQLLADSFQQCRPPEGDSDRFHQWQNCVRSIAHALSRDNFRFGRELFFAACELDERKVGQDGKVVA